MSPKIVALGVAPRFPKVKNFLRSYELSITNYEQNAAHLAAYAAGKPVALPPIIPGIPDTYTATSARQDLNQFATAKYWFATQKALKGQADWAMEWRTANAYRYWALIENYVWHVRALAEFQHGKRLQKLKMMTLREMGFCLGNCVVLGWFEPAKRLAAATVDSLQKQLFNDGETSFAPSRIQYFVLRLVCDWQNIPLVLHEQCASDEPLYEVLLQNWRNPDVEELTPLLLAALDRHTHQARRNRSDEYFDLPWSDMWYVPFEVLSVLRLRESLGLSVPSLDHPLMQTPLGILPPITGPYMDDLLQSVLAQMEREVPEFKVRV